MKTLHRLFGWAKNQHTHWSKKAIELGNENPKLALYGGCLLALALAGIAVSALLALGRNIEGVLGLMVALVVPLAMVAIWLMAIVVSAFAIWVLSSAVITGHIRLKEKRAMSQAAPTT